LEKIDKISDLYKDFNANNLNPRIIFEIIDKINYKSLGSVIRGKVQKV